MILLLLVCAFGVPADGISAGDRAFEREHYDEAIRCYERVADHHDADAEAEAEWKLARAVICRADVSPIAEQQEAYHRALAAAEHSLQIRSQCSNAHTWYAIALGYVAIGEGVRSQIQIAHRIKAEVEEAIRLDPSNDVAYSIQGTLFRSLGNVGWVERQLAAVLIGKLPEGGYPEAEKALCKAIALAPDVIRHRYELGLLYLDWGKKDAARQTFLKTLPLPPAIASDRIRIADIRKRLEQM